MDEQMAQMERMVNQVGTSQDTSQLRDNLHQVQHYTNQVAKETNNYIKDLMRHTQNANQSEQHQCKMQNERLMNEFTAALNNFLTVQCQAVEKEKASVARARASSGYLNDPFGDDKQSDDEVDGLDSSTQAEVQMEQDVDLQPISQEQQHWRKLQSDILTIKQMAEDLPSRFLKQEEDTDILEAKVKRAQVHLSQGSEQLQMAKEYQSKARRKKCIIAIIAIIIIILIVIFAIIVLITSHTAKKN